MNILVTGAAGFIGFHLSQQLLAEGHAVVGVDNLNDYYDVRLKEARLAQLTPHKQFKFYREDFSDREAMQAIMLSHQDITHIVHLGAQAGVRHSLTDPYIYITSNVMAQTVMLECARLLPRLEHLVYASSSSVYGGNTKLPFAESDRVDHPVSLYAATKKACELISHAYGHIYQIPTTGLRFFTVYGPWGRPDMAAYIFTRKIFAGEPIEVFNHGKMQRDFTYIDDIIQGTRAAMLRTPASGEPTKVYNLGNHRSEDLMNFIGVLEKAVGKESQKLFLPLQPGDVPATYADITEAERDLGFRPTTSIDVGIPKFVQWYREYHRISVRGAP
jgi:UDP-glucuronate 4-epimerase